ncbi:uncharacterized protein LOC124354156 [Homalodisca vitripennis]|uniref:uncharacterized protein LOC124354156 n=1 Tax=Homalodisca vitripennis TaxID=197043 RepID=UPI001EECE1E7|nr:uncharacterized protein LOC124354156 [Homalodisca vitripennis]XP_046660371.1 uncharacterized protein LOC124354156 [Homalodisca vitripennis]
MFSNNFLLFQYMDTSLENLLGLPRGGGTLQVENYRSRREILNTKKSCSAEEIKLDINGQRSQNHQKDKMLNSLPEDLKKTEVQKFPRRLKSWLQDRPFYSLAEFYNWKQHFN